MACRRSDEPSPVDDVGAAASECSFMPPLPSESLPSLRKDIRDMIHRDMTKVYRNGRANAGTSHHTSLCASSGESSGPAPALDAPRDPGLPISARAALAV
jgi:hypothetical protein